MAPTTDTLMKIGSIFRKKLETYMADRNLLEEQWLKNLRQYQAKYDADIEKRIPADRSKAYPRNTRVKVKAAVASMMEMMFPAKDRNWELIISPNPSIPKEALDGIILALEQQALQTGQPVTSDDIERAVTEYAKERKDKMQDEIDDQITDANVDYPGLCRFIVLNGHLYGYGVARSPIVRNQQERQWVRNDLTGEWEAKTKMIRRPYPEKLRVWDFYPDLSAKSWEGQDLVFERSILNRSDLAALASRKDFFGDAIRTYLREHPTGNYSPQPFETELRDIAKTANVDSLATRKYEVYRGLGFVTSAEMMQLGAEIPESERHKDVFADVWFTDSVIIKARIAAFGDRPSDQYHRFVYTDDEDSGFTGVGLPDDVRDSQMALCATTRALFDNMAATAGPVYEVNESLLAAKPNKAQSIRAFDTIYTNAEGIDAQYPAVRALNATSHIPELLSILSDQRQQLDVESNLPAFLTGNNTEPLGEAFRTSGNMSMMRGGANMLTKDTVRSFDRFTMGVIGSLLRWNMEFNPKKDIKGDFGVQARGAASLVAKEVRGAALDQLVATFTPEDKAMLDQYGLMIDRLQSRDLPTDRVLPREEAMQVLAQMREAQAQSAQVEQGFTQAKTASAQADAQKTQVDAATTAQSANATIAEILSRVEANLATAKESGNRVQLENLKVLLTASLGGGNGEPGVEQGAGAGAEGAPTGA